MVSPAEVCLAVRQLLMLFFVWAAHLPELHVSLPWLTLCTVSRMRFGNQCHSAARSPGGLGVDHEQGQSARTWIFCQILGCCLVGVTANTTFSWAHTFTQVHNVSHCWVYTELPIDAGDGLPWHLHPASRVNWNTLIQWNANRTARSPWDLRRQTIEEILRCERGIASPPIERTVWNGWGWMNSVYVKMRHLSPLCIEQQFEHKAPNRTVGWLPEELCAKIIYNVNASTWWDGRPLIGVNPTDFLPPGYLWVCGTHGWCYLPAKWTGRCTWGRAYLPGHIWPILTERPTNWDPLHTRWHQGKHAA
nr:endogenous retrovirus group PABLB member 1 Env polyprotein-like [Vicugna pacos]